LGGSCRSMNVREAGAALDRACDSLILAGQGLVVILWRWVLTGANREELTKIAMPDDHLVRRHLLGAEAPGNERQHQIVRVKESW